jgi:hypothetical protein
LRGSPWMLLLKNIYCVFRFRVLYFFEKGLVFFYVRYIVKGVFLKIFGLK